jgi:hypothetical protein
MNDYVIVLAAIALLSVACPLIALLIAKHIFRDSNKPRIKYCSNLKCVRENKCLTGMCE